MCASYWIKKAEADWAAWMQWLDLDAEAMNSPTWTNSDFKKKDQEYNFPGYEVPVVGQREGQRKLAHYRWGFLPPWAKSPTHKPAPFNARSETVSTSGMFKHAFKKQRCIIPANGFYEWHEVNGKKVRYLFTPIDQPFLAFAGLWSDWQNQVRSCSIVTTGPNVSVEPFHDRMPLILDRAGVATWLDAKSGEKTLIDLMMPSPMQLMHTV